MIKKIVALVAVLALCLSFTVACKQKKPSGPSSSIVSSDKTSSDTSSVIIDATAWGSDENASLIRYSFLSSDKNGDIFYCAASGGIYKQIVSSNKLSKIYSNSSYNFTSVSPLDEKRICAGFTKDDKSGYIIFNLEEKTIANAVSDPLFSEQSIHSLTFVGGAKFFLASPDRYGRFTLYKEEKDVAKPIARGVNEYVISRNRIFYNVGSTIFSLNLNGEDMHVICELETNDLLGFTVVGDMLIYMSSTDTFCLKMTATEPSILRAHLNVYTCVSDGVNAYFCGANGGIYSVSLANGYVTHLSDYTASSLVLDGEFLYMTPAEREDYPSILEEYIISGGIYRFPLSELINKPTTYPETSSSLSQNENSSDLTSSSLSNEEEKPLTPELFGK